MTVFMSFLHKKLFYGSYSDPLGSFVERKMKVGAVLLLYPCLTLCSTHTPYNKVSVYISKIFLPVKIKIFIFISSIVGLVSQVGRNIVLLLVLVIISCEQHEGGWVRWAVTTLILNFCRWVGQFDAAVAAPARKEPPVSTE